jgi:hypothetical protein
MVVYGVMVVNSSGGLIFYQQYGPNPPQIDSDAPMVIGSTLHSLHAITVAISPIPKSSGFTELECTTWKLNCLQTITGLKFMVFSEGNHPKIKQLLDDIYSAYADYVLKNPFYTMDMPVANSCQKFVLEVKEAVEKENASVKDGK